MFRSSVKIYSLFGLLIIAFCTTFRDLPATGIPLKHTVYFFSSETNINNFSSLKFELDTYLADYGAFQFQPFSDRQTFERFIAGKQDGVFLLSSWHYRSLKSSLPMEAVLVGMAKGKTTQTRILSAKKKVADLDMLRGKTVASAGTEEFTKNILLKMLGLGKREFVETLQILTVPKDIDALMAVGFDMADAALTTERSLTKLMALNPIQYGMLSRLGMSQEILLPIVAVPEEPDAHVDALVNAIENMGAEPTGEQKLKMLGLDGWRRLGPAEKEMLNR